MSLGVSPVPEEIPHQSWGHLKSSSIDEPPDPSDPYSGRRRKVVASGTVRDDVERRGARVPGATPAPAPGLAHVPRAARRTSPMDVGSGHPALGAGGLGVEPAGTDTGARGRRAVASRGRGTGKSRLSSASGSGRPLLVHLDDARCARSAHHLPQPRLEADRCRAGIARRLGVRPGVSANIGRLWRSGKLRHRAHERWLVQPSDARACAGQRRRHFGRSFQVVGTGRAAAARDRTGGWNRGRGRTCAPVVSRLAGRSSARPPRSGSLVHRDLPSREAQACVRRVVCNSEQLEDITYRREGVQGQSRRSMGANPQDGGQELHARRQGFRLHETS